MKYKFIIIGLLLLLVAGCSDTSTVSTVDGYYSCFSGDTEMVEAAFASYAPTSSEADTYEPGEEIDIEIVLGNKMPVDIDEGKIKLRLTQNAAIDTVFSGASVVTNPELYAIDTETCSTEHNEEEAEIGPLIYQKDIDTQVKETITGQYCYELPVEVHGYLYFTDDETLIGDNLPEGANPPSAVKITNIEQNIVDVDEDTAELRFKITIENVGDGTIVEGLDECFEYRETGYKEELTLSIEGPYRPECPDDIKLSRDTMQDVITCKVYDIDKNNLGDTPAEIIITLDGFAYEQDLESVDIWIEP